MQTFQLVNGDLNINTDGTLELVSGADRIAQELTCWILEPLGTDRVYTSFGSKLGTYIGAAMTSANIAEVRSEVVRIVNNYIAYQTRQIKTGDSTNWADDDIINTINRISVTQSGDTLKVVVRLTTVAGESVSLTQSL